MSSPFPTCDHDHGACLNDVVARAEMVCTQNHARLTVLRKEVLTILAASHRAMTAYEILEEMVVGGTRKPAPITVYRTLEFLMSMALVHRIESRNAYFVCYQHGDHHDQAVQVWICRSCGVVAETNSPQMVTLIPQLAQEIGFKTVSTIVEVEGECRTCQQQA
ncbi:Fur family transcriptional regulator [Magnetococcus sp. PR-3]|uniref:Fur family transcriptional regulator n=1 Tax=Magnetococcus sp. PR-3 TaxID=3120355 RepID=UPI002FCE3768